MMTGAQYRASLDDGRWIFFEGDYDLDGAKRRALRAAGLPDGGAHRGRGTHEP